VTVLETSRLVLRHMSNGDAAFMLRLLNEPSFIRYIGDKGVRTLDEARRYIDEGPVDSYRRHGFGLYLVELKGSRAPLGMCGLLKRDWLDHVDVGFAFLPEYWSQGYAIEAASAVVRHGHEALDLRRMLAITSPDNIASQRLLGKLGFRLEGTVRPPGEAHDICLFAL
jgi:ribosomal-protein-alanine N-acetyltransferase